MELLRLQDRHISRNSEASIREFDISKTPYMDRPSERSYYAIFECSRGFKCVKNKTIQNNTGVDLWFDRAVETGDAYIPHAVHGMYHNFGRCGISTWGPNFGSSNNRAKQGSCLNYLLPVLDKKDIDGKRVKLAWLKSAFELDGNSNDKYVKCPARAYIVLLIGVMLMPDKSSAMVHTQYLQFLSLPWEAGSYSWGSAILAFLYREMCKASKMLNVDGRELNAGIGGCMVLLQSWAW
ncbi:hypothetical protein GQ457_11G027390 [Hibiscus cannabinus]